MKDDLINNSDVDSRIAELTKNKVVHVVKVLGKVAVIEHGIASYYSIRRLEYSNKVVLEQIQRNPICTSTGCAAGVIVSIKFIVGDEPKKWPLDVCIQ